MCNSGLAESQLKPYDHGVFDGLIEFEVAKAQLEEHRDTIGELGAIIRKFGYEDLLAINLLHKHFDIHPDEVIVRRFEHAENLAYMNPRSADEALGSSVPYLWAYAPGRDGPGWYPIEFVERSSVSCGGFHALLYSDALLIELAEYLESSILAHLFGIAATYSRDGFTVDSGRTVLETTDEEARLLTLQAVPKAVVDDSPDTTQTLWIFNEAGSVINI